MSTERERRLNREKQRRFQERKRAREIAEGKRLPNGDLVPVPRAPRRYPTEPGLEGLDDELRKIEEEFFK